MNPTSDPYKDVVGVYIQLLKRDSLEVGVAVEQIHVTCGARTAVQAALVITLLKMSVKENYQLPDLTIHTGITTSAPEALPLLRHAVACCYLAWGWWIRTSFSDNLIRR